MKEWMYLLKRVSLSTRYWLWKTFGRTILSICQLYKKVSEETVRIEIIRIIPLNGDSITTQHTGQETRLTYIVRSRFIDLKLQLV